MARKKRCAWISRHKPTKAQRRDLVKAGYTIRQVNPAGRVWGAKDAWMLAQNACGGFPDLCVVVLPIDILRAFLTLVAGQTLVVQAPARQTGPGVHDWEWLGHWLEVHRVVVETSVWRPG